MEHVKLGETRTVPIHSVSRHPLNARRGDTSVLERSLRDHSQYAPIVVHEPTGYILKGNNTHRVMSEVIGLSEVSATFISCTEAQALAILAVDNRSTDRAEYDEVALLALLERIDAAGSLDLSGYGQADIDELSGLLDAAEEPGMPFDDPMPTPPLPPAASASSAAADRPADEPTIADRKRDYDDHPTRTLIFTLPAAQHAWAVTSLRAISEENRLTGEADALLLLISQYVEEDIPSGHQL